MVVDMKIKKSVNLTKILKEEHQNKWVLYSPSEMKVIAYDQDLEKAINKGKSSLVKDLILHKVIPFDTVLAPSLSTH